MLAAGTCSQSLVFVFPLYILSVYFGSIFLIRSVDHNNYKVYRVLDHVCLHLATFRENFLS